MWNKKDFLKIGWGLGTLSGLAVLSVASAAIPRQSVVTDDTSLYQNLSEINIKKEAEINFDSDINRLSRLEHRYRERLPKLSEDRLKQPMGRIQSKSYKKKRTGKKATPSKSRYANSVSKRNR